MVFSKLSRYGKNLDSHDLVKILAVILMIIDHIGEYLIADNLWYRLVGRGAAPLFCFLIGYVNRLHISRSLITYGLILSLTSAVLMGHFWMNILITFMIGSLILHRFPPEQYAFSTKMVFFILLCACNGLIMPYVEYGFLGLLWMISARLCALKTRDALFWLILTILAYYGWEAFAFQFYLKPVFLSALAILMGCLGVLMASYRLSTFPRIRLLRLPGLIISRYSLEIYFYHLISLQGYLLLTILKKFTGYF